MQAYLERHGIDNKAVKVTLPPLLCSSLVQLVNQPIIRASITLQVHTLTCAMRIIQFLCVCVHGLHYQVYVIV
jgi:hypothetical protein